MVDPVLGKTINLILAPSSFSTVTVVVSLELPLQSLRLVVASNIDFTLLASTSIMRSPSFTITATDSPDPPTFAPPNASRIIVGSYPQSLLAPKRYAAAACGEIATAASPPVILWAHVLKAE